MRGSAGSSPPAPEPAPTCATVVCDAATSACKVQGTCEDSTGLCSAETDAVNGTPCDDGDEGTSADACVDGACLGTSELCAGYDVSEVVPGSLCDAGINGCYAEQPEESAGPHFRNEAGYHLYRTDDGQRFMWAITRSWPAAPAPLAFVYSDSSFGVRLETPPQDGWTDRCSGAYVAPGSSTLRLTP